MKSVSIIGFGKLGSAMGAVFAKKGFKVVCYDIDIQLNNKFKKKKYLLLKKIYLNL